MLHNSCISSFIVTSQMESLQQDDNDKEVQFLH